MAVLKMTVIVRDRGLIHNDLLKIVEWPVVPRVGDLVDLIHDGVGIDASVCKVRHCLGTGEIEVVCQLQVDDDWESLTEEGWKPWRGLRKTA